MVGKHLLDFSILLFVSSCWHYLQHPGLDAMLASQTPLSLWGPQTYQAFDWDTAAAGRGHCVFCVCVRSVWGQKQWVHTELEWISVCWSQETAGTDLTLSEDSSCKTESGASSVEVVQHGCICMFEDRKTLWALNVDKLKNWVRIGIHSFEITIVWLGLWADVVVTQHTFGIRLTHIHLKPFINTRLTLINTRLRLRLDGNDAHRI